MELLLLCTAVTWKASPLILRSQGMQWIINCKPDKQCLAGVAPQTIYIFNYIHMCRYIYMYTCEYSCVCIYMYVCM